MTRSFFHSVPNRSIDLTTLAEYKMFGIICSYINEKNECWPSYATLANRLGTTPRKAMQYIKSLKEKGLIEVRNRSSKINGRTLTNIYSVVFDDKVRTPLDEIPEVEETNNEEGEGDPEDTLVEGRVPIEDTPRGAHRGHPEQEQLIKQALGRACARDVSHETFHDNSSKKKKGTHLPENWELPSEWRQWCLERGMFNDEIDRIEITFKNYWLSTNKNSIKIDWFRTWQNWCIKDYENKGKSLSLPKKTYQLPELKKIPGNNLSYPTGLLFTQETTDPVVSAWNKGQERLRDILTEATYYSWFSKIQFKGIIKGEALFVAPTKFLADYITRNFYDQIKLVLDEKLKEIYPDTQVRDIRFVI